MRFAPALMALALFACAETPTTSGPVDVQVELAPGDVADVREAGITIGFQGVTGDSRCPADALCIQGGDAIVRIAILGLQGAPTMYDLHTGDMQPVRHGDLTIALRTLSPYPFSGRSIDPAEYRATLHITR